VEKRIWEYCSLLSIGTKHAKNTALFPAGSWSCGTRAARFGRQYCHILLLYFSVEFIYVYFTKTVPAFPSWNLTEGGNFVFHERSVRYCFSYKRYLKYKVNFVSCCKVLYNIAVL
jgi:hypothetical protein